MANVSKISMTKQSQKEYKLRSNHNNGSPVNAHLQLVPLWPLALSSYGQVKSANKNNVPLKRSSKPKRLRAPNCKKDLAVCLESKQVEALIAELNDNKTGVHGAETVFNSDLSVCPQNQINIPDPFWYHSRLDDITNKLQLDTELPTFSWAKMVNPLTTGELLPMSNTGQSTMDLELTPPSSTDSESVISNNGSEHSFPQDFVRLNQDVKVPECPRQESPRPKYSDPNVCKNLEVGVVPIDPTLCQLQNLYRRERLQVYQRQNSFRDKNLRPKKSLRQFVPFAMDTLISSQPREKKLRNITSSGKPGPHERYQIKRRKICQAQLFVSANKTQLTLVLKQKKEQSKLRNKYENALDSINRRLFRQNQFWRTLPG